MKFVLHESPFIYQLAFFGLLWLLVFLLALTFILPRLFGFFRSKLPVPAPAVKAKPQWELIIETEGSETTPARTEHILLSSEQVTIGRAETADLKFDDEFTSSIHAILKQDEDILLLEDQGSTNGSFINDMPVTKPIRLHHGDVIRIGKTQLTVK